MALEKEDIIARVKECLIKGNRRFKAKARIARIVYSGNATNTPGRAVVKNGEYYIILSKHYLNHAPEWMMDEIIPHEVAHIIGFWLHDNGMDGSIDHDDRWEEIAHYLGSSQGSHPSTPDSYPHSSKHHYKTSTGNSIYLDKDRHHNIQNNFRTLTDRRDGGRITAGNYVGPAQTPI